jgi:outer membrane protein assembly factor BamB
MRNAKSTIGVLVGGVLLAGACAAADDWPQWRGPNRDNKVAGFAEPKTWPKELTQKWKVKVGLGDASPVLAGGKVYAFTRQDKDEVFLCLDAGDGHEIWKDHYAAQEVNGPSSRDHPGPRSTPAVAEGKVCTLGVGGVLSCLDAEKGAVVWRKDTKGVPRFFTASSPIIIDGTCVAQLGGQGKSGEVVAYDLASGDEKWKWTGEGPAYASPVLMTVDGTKQLVMLTETSVVGVGAADGKLLWEVPFEAKGMGAYNSITPVVDGQTVIVAREGTGTTALKVEKKDDGFAAKELWQKKQSAGKFNTPMLKDGLLYGLSPASGGGGGGGMRDAPTNFFCMDAQTGDVLWTDSTKRGTCGAVLDAGPVLLALTSDSTLVAFKPDNKGYSELASYKVADTPTWGVPVISGNRVFVKDRDSLTLWTIE